MEVSETIPLVLDQHTNQLVPQSPDQRAAAPAVQLLADQPPTLAELPPTTLADLPPSTLVDLPSTTPTDGQPSTLPKPQIPAAPVTGRRTRQIAP